MLGFAWQYARQRGVDPAWRLSHLSDIPHVLKNQRLPGGAEDTPEQLDLGKIIGRRCIKFFYFREYRRGTEYYFTLASYVCERHRRGNSQQVRLRLRHALLMGNTTTQRPLIAKTRTRKRRLPLEDLYSGRV